MKIFLEPRFEGVDEGDGGIRRVVEGQRQHLSSYGVELVDTPQQADIIHCHIAPYDETERYLIEHPEIPLAIQSHGMYWMEYEWKNWAIKANAKCMNAIRLADYVIAPSEWVAQSIRRNSLRPCIALDHGINIEDWEPDTKEGFVLWNKTRVDPVCDPEPVGKLALLMPQIKFISTFGQSDIPNLHLTGTLPFKDAKAIIRHASIYLCTARETFGIGTLEAMAAGCPVVGWAWGGQRQIVEHKKTGWLSSPGDYDDLVKGIEYCMQNAEKMGAAARQRVIDQYQWKDVIKGYVTVYEQLLEQKSKVRPKVSIIVPAYNLEEYLPTALDSVL